MDKLLFLAHRIPYPPNKGDKIRSFNLLKYLSIHYQVYLGTFVENREDLRYLPTLQQLCHEVRVEKIKPKLRKLASLRGLFQRVALSVPYYSHRRLFAWVEEKLASDAINHVFVFSSPMAQYVLDERYQSLRRIADFVDVDSQKWRQYGEQHKWPMSWLYQREGTQLLKFEREVARRFDASVFVSQSEAALFNQLAPEVAEKVSYLSNGVDTEFFSPERRYENPYPDGELPVVFTGAMDYWANGDAATWFAREVFPAIRAQAARARLFVVGAQPTEQVRRLGKLEGVNVTGTVEDIRPYLFHARLAVAPLRIARGLQNKVLEAMAMAKPVLATPAAMEGLMLPLAFTELVSDDPATLAERAVAVLTRGDRSELGRRGREFVEQTYSWERAWQRLDTLLRGLHHERRVVRLSA